MLYIYDTVIIPNDCLISIINVLFSSSQLASRQKHPAEERLRTLRLEPVGQRRQTGETPLPQHREHGREREPPPAAVSHPLAPPPLLGQGSLHQRGRPDLLRHAEDIALQQHRPAQRVGLRSLWLLPPGQQHVPGRPAEKPDALRLFPGTRG
ncbi:hypothetical protein EYF80_013264 [Liparis tanakae]|uniref:Uncharacterized protein n=1 Tax=Liparis tanakae TaxID=230148 RepID=A0A4Z2IE74_9TELE|nr:hypothetical protein EYF80_013264 [Liparis tanakae]